MAINEAILALLVEADRPMHGYELTQAFNEAVAAPPRAPKGKLNPGQIYGILDRLQRDEFVTLDEIVNQEERPDKKLYRLTDKGRAAVRDWLQSTNEYEFDWRHDVFLKLVLAKRLPEGDVQAVLARERQRYVELLTKFTAARAQAQKQGLPRATLMGLELAEFQLKAMHDWLDRCEELLNEGAA